MKRSDAAYWQPVAGGGEGGENSVEAAVRETAEEVGVKAAGHQFVPIPPITFISVYDCFGRLLWGPRVTVIPQFFFSLESTTDTVTLSSEHTAYQWLPFDLARPLLYWEDNRNALTTLHRRLTGADKS
ncbi:MAG TPA: NUDIX domain-containing protein [candidate division Zixibacteria bacterium]|nr:NUDIX domain-containing protein [candidate division Zixibacteria bacterium]